MALHVFEHALSWRYSYIQSKSRHQTHASAKVQNHSNTQNLRFFVPVWTLWIAVTSLHCITCGDQGLARVGISFFGSKPVRLWPSALIPAKNLAGSRAILEVDKAAEAAGVIEALDVWLGARDHRACAFMQSQISPRCHRSSWYPRLPARSGSRLSSRFPDRSAHPQRSQDHRRNVHRCYPQFRVPCHSLRPSRPA